MKFGTEARTEKGKCIMEDADLFKDGIKALEGKRYRIRVEEIGKVRSTPQNAYYWAVVVKMVGNKIGERDQLAVHHMLKTMFNYRVFVGKEDQEIRIPDTTTELTTTGFSEYIEKIREWASSFLELNIPDPVRAGY